jgi:outer membrane protein assembly factor BamB
MRPLAAVLAAIVLSALTAAIATARSRATNWTQFRLVSSNNVVIPGSLSTSWRVVTGGPISASPTIDGTTLFVGNNVGNLNAIDVRDGRVLWTYHARNALMSAPLLYNGLVIAGEGDEVSTGAAPRIQYVGMGPSALIALDANTGALRWRTVVAGSAMPTPAIIDGILVHHNGAGWIIALDPMTGKSRYTINVHSIASMSAVLPIGSDLFVTTGVVDNSAMELHARDGKLVWRTTFADGGSGHGDCPPVSDGTRMFCDYVMPQPPAPYTSVGSTAIEHAYALDLKTGAHLWDIALQSGTLPPRNEAAIPLLYDGMLYLGSSVSPIMHAIDPSSGRIVWQAKAGAPVKAGSVAVDGVLYFGDLSGRLWAVNAKTGAFVGVKKMASGFNVGSPIVVGQTLITGSRTGSVYAIPLADIRDGRDQ